MSRIIRCVTPIWGEYITAGKDYTYYCTDAQMVYRRVPDAAGRTPGSYMAYSTFKRALRDGSIIFIDNL